MSEGKIRELFRKRIDSDEIWNMNPVDEILEEAESDFKDYGKFIQEKGRDSLLGATAEDNKEYINLFLKWFSKWMGK
jgi:hypothetical protein